MKKIILITMLLVMVIAGLNAQTYNLSEVGKLKTFFSQSSAIVAKNNGEALGITDFDDPSTWQGITWQSDVTDNKRVLEINWDTSLDNPIISGELDIKDFTALIKLSFAYNKITYLNITNCTALTELNCQDNSISALNVKSNIILTKLNCNNNAITNLDVSNNPALTLLSCYRNNISQLEISNNKVLLELNCSDNNLTELNVSQNTKLTHIVCSKNSLGQLDISNNIDLVHLSSTDCNLNNLDVSKNKALEVLSCNNNNLTSLDLSYNAKLDVLVCSNNNLPFSKLINPSKNTLSTYTYSEQLIAIGEKSADKYYISPNTTIDLSAEKNVYNTESSIVWKNKNGDTITPTTNNNWVYTFDASFANETIYCEITHTLYPELSPLKSVEVTIEQNTPPVCSDQVYNISENLTKYSLVGTIIATDADSDPLTFSIKSGNSNTAFAIDSSTGKITVNNSTAIDFETKTVFNLVASISDGTNVSDVNITINIININEAPVFSSKSFSLAENSEAATSIGTLSASDPESAPITFEIISGNTDNAFSLNSTTGELTVNTSSVLDYETIRIFNLKVDASDGTNKRSATISVIISDKNETPTFTDQSFTVAENSIEKTSIGTVSAKDPEASAITYTIVSGNKNNAFALNHSTGEFTVNNPLALDYESTQNYALIVSASDGTNSSNANVQINLEDVNEAPIFADQSFTIAENSSEFDFIGKLSANDPEAISITYTIVSGNENNAFSLDATTGNFTVNNGSVLDYEVKKTHALVVSVTDGLLSSKANVYVSLSNVNEAPIATDATFKIDENMAKGTLVGAVSATDPETDALSYSITSGNTNEVFAINENNGEISVNNQAALDYETTTVFNLTISVSDGSLTTTAKVDINLNDKKETTSIRSLAEQKIRIYPTLVTDQLNLDFENNNTEYTHYAIIDINGRQILRDQIMSQHNSIDINNLRKGMYIIQLQGKKHKGTARFCVK